MKIAYHIGFHFTDEDQLVRSLNKNEEVLMKEGIFVPTSGQFRNVMREAFFSLKGEPASHDQQEVVFQTILGELPAERLVLSYDGFVCGAEKALTDGMLYPNAGEKTHWMRNVFPDDEVEFFISVRNPATWVPALHTGLKDLQWVELRKRFDPELLHWSDVIRDIREHNPDSPITVWCNEDTPLIWPEVMHEVAGLDPQVQIMGGFDILSQIMAKEGIKRLRRYLGEHPPANEIQRRRVLSAFLEKYALEDEVEEVVDLPGWTDELVETLTELYDDDMIEIARIPGVTLLTA